MRNILRVLLLSAAVWLPSRAIAHCSLATVPTLELKIPRDGMSIEKVCWVGFDACTLDTFYREELLQELVDDFEKSQHVAFAYLDSLHNYLQFDTVWIGNQINFVDTGNAESLWVSIPGELKGTLPRQAFPLKDRFPTYIPDKPFNTTYMPIIDTPFIAFFDTYATPYEMGLGPLDGCFFEPRVHLVKNGRIYKQSSLETERMPGIWVAVEDFFRAVGIPSRPVPQPRPPRSGIRRNPGGPRLSLANRRPGSVFLHDLRGKRLGRLFPEGDLAAGSILPAGWYFLRAQGQGWMETRRLFFPGGTSIVEAAGLPGRDRGK